MKCSAYTVCIAPTVLMLCNCLAIPYPNRNTHNTHVFTARIPALIGDLSYLLADSRNIISLAGTLTKKSNLYLLFILCHAANASAYSTTNQLQVCYCQ